MRMTIANGTRKEKFFYPAISPMTTLTMDRNTGKRQKGTLEYPVQEYISIESWGILAHV
jgi:hypothetical protein